jgi:hypothetical protein
MSRSGDFCADEQTDSRQTKPIALATPRACVRGNLAVGTSPPERERESMRRRKLGGVEARLKTD